MNREVTLCGLRLGFDAWGHLVASAGEGQAPMLVQAVRAFPISDPTCGIALCDDNGKELVWIDDLETLPPAVRGIIEEDLARRQFLPILRRIVRISAPMEPCEWEVETDRGPTRFTLGSQENVRRLTNHRVLVVDSQGVRYFIPDARQLDADSLRLLERYF